MTEKVSETYNHGRRVKDKQAHLHIAAGEREREWRGKCYILFNMIIPS